MKAIRGCKQTGMPFYYVKKKDKIQKYIKSLSTY